MAKGKGKGQLWERDVARDLTELLTGTRNPPALWRSVLSGGWESRGVPDIGDLRPANEDGFAFRNVFAVEAKHRADEPDFYRLFTSKDPALIRWWGKLTSECAAHHLCPMLVAKQNRRPPLIGLPANLLSTLMPASSKVIRVATANTRRELIIEPWHIAPALELAEWLTFLTAVKPERLLYHGRQWISKTYQE